MKKYAILCVDDEENVLRSLQRNLMFEDYEAFYAKDVLAALALMEKKEIAVVIADMKMPDMDGLSFLMEVKKKWPLTVRIILSGYLQIPQLIAAINTVGIFRFIPKPWRPQEDLLAPILEAVAEYKEIEEAEDAKAVLKARNNTYQNVIRRVNENIEASKHGTALMGIAGKSIFHELGELALQSMKGETIKDLLFKIGALFEDVSMLSSMEFCTMEIEEIMEKVASALATFDGIKRVDLEPRKFINNKVRVKDGLIEYALCNLIDNMLPGIKKYVKIFLQETELENTENISFIVVISPIHREESDNDALKGMVQPVFRAFARALMDSFDGSFEIINKGTRYLLKLEFPRFIPVNLKKIGNSKS